MEAPITAAALKVAQYRHIRAEKCRWGPGLVDATWSGVRVAEVRSSWSASRRLHTSPLAPPRQRPALADAC